MISIKFNLAFRLSCVILFAAGPPACVTGGASKTNGYPAAESNIVLIPASKPVEINKATPIAKCILSLPVRPEVRSFFQNMVLHAAADYPTVNRGESDKLFIGGDGSRGEITFLLDRVGRFMKVSEVDKTRSPAVRFEYYLYQVPGGWLQSDKSLPIDGRLLSHYPVQRYWEGVGG